MSNHYFKKIGVIADDFTGASDAASFLVKSGLETIMVSNQIEHIPKSDAIVVALKTRSVDVKTAIQETKRALSILKNNGCNIIYFKYCSTFDSTPKGNIGPVLDYLLDFSEQDYTVICPSLPVNGRTVKDGLLYVYGVPLADSHMKDHPLNPMWDSNIVNLLAPQSKYPAFVIPKSKMNTKELLRITKDLKKKHDKFYLIPDFESDEDGQAIANGFNELTFWSGGSSLLEFINPQENIKLKQTQQRLKSIILCGSCSEMTKKQINYYKAVGGLTYPVDSKKLLGKELSYEAIYNSIKNHERPVLVYSSAIDQNMDELRKSETFIEESVLMEETLSKLSTCALDDDFNNIVVAGGETSGAVTLELGFDSFIIGENIAPSIPILRPLEKNQIQLILKSGNFGDEDFFVKAIGGIENV